MMKKRCRKLICQTDEHGESHWYGTKKIQFHQQWFLKFCVVQRPCCFEELQTALIFQSHLMKLSSLNILSWVYLKPMTESVTLK